MTQPEFEPELESAEDAAGAMVLVAVRDDVGPFQHLGSQFRCNKIGWVGKAVASPVAVYLLKKAKNNQGYGGGIVGVMLAAALASDDNMSTCAAADLPGPVRAVMDPKGKLALKDVVIIPKATVSYVKGGGFNNQITVESGADKFKIATSLFSIFARPRAMRAMGWVFNTRLTPTAAPVHDTRTVAQRTQGNTKPWWVKALLIIGAIVVVVLYILLRVVGDMH